MRLQQENTRLEATMERLSFMIPDEEDEPEEDSEEERGSEYEGERVLEFRR